MKRWWLALFLPIVTLGGCSSGGGSSVSPVVLALAAMRPDLLFFYFGIVGDQILETASHVNCLMTDGWGDWSSAQGRQDKCAVVRGQMAQAVSLGVTKIILCVDFLVFDLQWNCRGPAELSAFRDQLEGLGLWKYVVALFVIDEPELKGIGDAALNAANAMLRQFGKPLAVNYTDNAKWPGLATADWASFDKYGVDYRGDGLLNDLKGRLGPSQRIILYSGGADPWHDNVRPVLEYANIDPQVIGICGFLWGDYDGKSGIRNNERRAEFIEVGAAIKGAA